MIINQQYNRLIANSHSFRSGILNQKREKGKWLSVALLCWFMMSVASVVSASQLSHSRQIKQLFEIYQPMDKHDQSKPLIDLELMIIATLLDQSQQPHHANQYRQYLMEFYSSSSLAKIASPIPNDTPYLTAYDPDPLISRLIKDTFYYIQNLLPSKRDPIINEFVELMELLLKKDQAAKIRQLTTFVKHSPDSIYSGWATYYLAWYYYLSSADQQELFYDLWQGHPQHPIGKESLAVMDLSYFPPKQMSLLSATLPGWGEEYLEPGLKESGGQLYYELLYLAGAIGFAVAAQQNNRVNNLTGALVFSNLLLLNHQGSADRAFVMAHRRNYAEQRKFIGSQFHQSLLAKGHFEPPRVNLEQGPLIEHYLKLGLFYQLSGMSDDVVKLDWLRSEANHNLGFSASYQIENCMINSEYYQFALGLMPHLNFLMNPLLDNPNNPILTQDGQQIETTGRLNLLFSNRLKLHSGAKLSLNLKVGTGYRWRAMTLEEQTYTYPSWIAGCDATLAWHGVSGHFWEVGISMDDSFKHEQLTIFNETISLQSKSWRVHFQLGVQL